ncbi:signal peptidase II [Acidocella sp.]|jgi:lipoprotein signal peptidase|uniref:signal peptidase II n=1 Tax=Acidocella sp. TaxID=50710 RepID=UPI002F40FD55
MDRRVAGYLLALIVLAADQGVKYWVLHGLHLQDGHLLVVLPVVNFVLVWNHGITFGMFAGDGAKLLLATVASAVIIALCVWLWRSKNWVSVLAIGAITGGAIGNVADRLRYGAVVDFIQAHIGGVYFPWVFNVGDSAICCGVAVLMLENLLRRPVAASDGQR